MSVCDMRKPYHKDCMLLFLLSFHIVLLPCLYSFPAVFVVLVMEGCLLHYSQGMFKLARAGEPTKLCAIGMCSVTIRLCLKRFCGLMGNPQT